MKELFLNYELSLKLKELGFDENCFAGYSVLYGSNPPPLITPTTKNELVPFYGKYKAQNKHILKAPLKFQIFDWFRNEHNLISEIKIDTVYINAKYSYKVIHKLKIPYLPDLHTYKFDTYEETELACIEEMMNIIKQKQNEQ